jgi:hypothetical protein
MSDCARCRLPALLVETSLDLANLRQHMEWLVGKMADEDGRKATLIHITFAVRDMEMRASVASLPEHGPSQQARYRPDLPESPEQHLKNAS